MSSIVRSVVLDGVGLCAMGRWTLGPGRWGARRTDWKEDPALRPTMPCLLPLFSCPPSPCFTHMQTDSHTYKHLKCICVRTEKEAIAAICCVDLRISLLKHSRRSQEGEKETERNFFVLSLFFSLFFSILGLVCLG